MVVVYFSEFISKIENESEKNENEYENSNENQSNPDSIPSELEDENSVFLYKKGLFS